MISSKSVCGTPLGRATEFSKDTKMHPLNLADVEKQWKMKKNEKRNELCNNQLCMRMTTDWAMRPDWPQWQAIFWPLLLGNKIKVVRAGWWFGLVINTKTKCSRKHRICWVFFKRKWIVHTLQRDGKWSFSPEVFQLFGHFSSLEALNFLSATLLGVIREHVWSGSVL